MFIQEHEHFQHLVVTTSDRSTTIIRFASPVCDGWGGISMRVIEKVQDTTRGSFRETRAYETPKRVINRNTKILRVLLKSRKVRLVKQVLRIL